MDTALNPISGSIVYQSDARKFATRACLSISYELADGKIMLEIHLAMSHHNAFNKANPDHQCHQPRTSITDEWQRQA